MGKSWTTPFLLAVIAIQWVLFVYLLQNNARETSSNASSIATTTTATSGTHLSAFIGETKRYLDNASDTKDKAVRIQQPTQSSQLSGVAVTVIFRAPKWFFLRYKVMLDNALANLPDQTWKVQVFVNEPWVQDQLLPWHPGLARILSGQHPRVLVTPLPTNLTQGKPKEVVLSSWFWENMAADRVILFSGNGAFCGNQPVSAWDDILDLDYVGVPWGEYGGRGGDGGSHTLRHRQAMLRVFQYAAETTSRHVKGPEHRHVLDIMMHMNQQKLSQFKIATPEQTVAFGGVYNLSNEAGLVRLPLTVAGTQARLTYEERDSLLKHCPELKVIFPSLHEPACFGAHPDGQKCKATICALQENVPSHGC